MMKEKREILVLTERRGELANTLWSALLGSASAAGVTVAAMGTFFILGGAPVSYTHLTLPTSLIV